MKKILIILSLLFVFTAVPVFADTCTDIQTKIENLQTKIESDSEINDATLDNVSFTMEQNDQWSALKQSYNSQINAQKQKNQQALDYYTQHYPQPAAGNQWNPNSGQALIQWTAGKQKIIDDGSQELQDLEDKGNADINNMSLQFEAQDKNIINTEYLKNKMADELSIQSLQNSMSSCRVDTLPVIVAVPIPVAQPAKVTNKKTIVAINKPSSIINTATTTIMTTPPFVPDEIYSNLSQPKLNFWQKIIKFFKRIF